MSLTLPLPVDPNETMRSYQLTTAQKLQAKLLGVETHARLETAVTELTKQLANFRLSGPIEQRTEQMLQHAYMQGARDKLMELVNDADEAFISVAIEPTQPA
mgnify:FL=1